MNPKRLRFSRAAVYFACLVALAAWTHPVQAAFHCDLAYEILTAQDAVATEGGETLLPLVQAEAGRLERLIEEISDSAGVEISPAVTWGGWRGQSSPAIHLSLQVPGPEDWVSARRLAAQLAWLYRQEAVLLACGAAGRDEELIPTYTVQAQPQTFFADPHNLFAFFGTLMAFAQEVDLGYTRRGNAFWTVDFAGNLEGPLKRTIGFFETLSAGAVRFTLKREAHAVFLVGPDEALPDARLEEVRMEIQRALHAHLKDR
ncbi:MAG TPA: hypothetical protein VKY54_05495 [Kiloniellales bacterium]|nr:hypothetical protein [Kiloniellales bacterium]